MSDKFKVPTKAKLPEDVVVPHPTRCMYRGCQEPPDVVLAVYMEGGQRRVSYPPHAHGFKAESWIARCADHYLTELYGSGHGVYQALCDRGSFIPHPDNLDHFRADQPKPPKAAYQSTRLVTARHNTVKAIGELIEAMPVARGE